MESPINRVFFSSASGCLTGDGTLDELDGLGLDVGCETLVGGEGGALEDAGGLLGVDDCLLWDAAEEPLEDEKGFSEGFSKGFSEDFSEGVALVV